MKTSIASQRNQHTHTRAVTLLLSFVLAITGLLAVTPAASANNTGGYPYAGVGGLGVSSSGSAWMDGNGNSINLDNGYYYRNCTDYVAWKLKSLNVPDDKVRNLGNGGEWATKAAGRSGVTVNTTPAYGAAAVMVVSPGDSYGHVAFVEEVFANGTIRVSEYNRIVQNMFDGAYHERIGYPAALGFSKFVHFGLTSPTPSLGNTSDFNLDGRADIAWYEGWNNGTITALLATSNGGFSPSPLISGMGAPDWAGIGDFNADGRADVAWYHQSSLTLHVAQAGSNGVWSVTARLTGINKPDWAGVGDFNADGKDDIAWYEGWNNGTITALVSTGSGFSNGPLVSGLGAPKWAGVGDFNADGRSDIAWYHDGNNTLNLVRGNSGGVWSVSGIIPGLSAPSWVGVGDFNADGKDDIAWYEGWNNGTITALLATSAGGFSPSVLMSGLGAPKWAGVGDFNADGKDEIAWYHDWNSTLHLVRSNPAGVWSVGGVVAGLSAPTWASFT